MKLRLALLGLIAAGAVASSSITPPQSATAEDVFIGTYAYTIPGADVRVNIYCQAGDLISIYRLTATDSADYRYWLMYDAADIPYVRVNAYGPVHIDGTDMTWQPHIAGEVAVVAVAVPPCWRAEEGPAPDLLGPIYRRWLPWVVR
jgi:hypothetical protein